jgi:hypothetical protein
MYEKNGTMEQWSRERQTGLRSSAGRFLMEGGQVMEMYQSGKNWLERLADAIPGLKGYRDKEARRDTDKRFREYLANRVEGSRGILEDAKRASMDQGKLEDLDDLDRFSQRLFRVAKIEEAELDRIYQHDLSMLEYVETLETSLKLYAEKPFAELKSEWEGRVKTLESKIEERKNLFTIAG